MTRLKKTRNNNILVLLVLVFSLAIFAVSSVNAAETIDKGSLLKTANSSTIYYLGEDNKLYIFPNDKTYFSWFTGFENIKIVSEEVFGSYTLGGNVYYKPGSLLVKTPTSYKVYAVGINGELRWMESEAMAKEFYGDNWSKLVDDVPEGFFTNYHFGKSIAKSDDYDPTLEEDQSPSVGHGRGLIAGDMIRNRILGRQERQCEYIKRSVNRLQARVERWGIKVPNLGDDYLAKCVVSVVNNDDKKITVCKTPKGNPAAAHTITISKNAFKNHLKEGYTLGACKDEDKTEGDDKTAPVISTVSATPSMTSALIKWTTNEESESAVEFDDEYPFTNSRSATNKEDVKNHSVTLDGLTASTTYYYIVKSVDGEGNLATSSMYSFNTTKLDVSGPVISEIEVVTSKNSANIFWNTDELANSKVYFSLASTTALNAASSSVDVAMETNHEIGLTELTVFTKYFFWIESVDALGNKTISSEQKFTTDED